MKTELQLLEFASQFEKNPGKYFLKYEQEQLDAILPQFHGYYLVQLGVFDNYNLKALSTMSHHIYVGRSAAKATDLCIVESHLSELPFQSESVDLFVLPHTLEFSADPPKLLNEIYNMLIPGGKLIILGFNPFSFIGLNKMLKSSKNTPWCGRLNSIGKLKFWLRESGFSLEYQKSFCFRPPLKNAEVLNKLSFLETLGRLCFSFFGGAYILLVEKKTVAPIPVKMKVYSKKVRVRSGFPEPSTNKSV